MIFIYLTILFFLTSAWLFIHGVRITRRMMILESLLKEGVTINIQSHQVLVTFKNMLNRYESMYGPLPEQEIHYESFN